MGGVDPLWGINFINAMPKKERNAFGVAQKIDYPIFVPAKKRIRFPIHIVMHAL
jgi:hypothetical protein